MAVTLRRDVCLVCQRGRHVQAKVVGSFSALAAGLILGSGLGDGKYFNTRINDPQPTRRNTVCRRIGPHLF
jgi:hypothetical protein